MTDSTPLPCPDCNGVGNIIMSTCCGRGCATCPGGEAMIQAVPCYRCKGRGIASGTNPSGQRVSAISDAAGVHTT